MKSIIIAILSATLGAALTAAFLLHVFQIHKRTYEPVKKATRSEAVALARHCMAAKGAVTTVASRAGKMESVTCRAVIWEVGSD